MSAYNRPGSANVALRNQLLSTDIGNIDITKETPVSQENNQHTQPIRLPQHQQQPPFPINSQQNYNQPYGYNHNNHSNQRFNQPGNFYPNQQIARPQFQPPLQPSSGSRRSSLTSSHSTFNQFLRFGKNKKGLFKIDGDNDDDEKDVMIDSSQSQEMRFDDLSTIKDRGRYGGQSSYDSMPIIPTLASPASKPQGNSSNIQYRKQMTALKKQAYVNAGKQGPQGQEIRAMSLQTGHNPYQPPQQFPGLYQNDPRSMSLTHNKPGLAPPRVGPMYGPPNTQHYHQKGNQPRSNSLMNNQHYNPRANSLVNQQYQPRANSLVNNPKFQQQNPYQQQYQQLQQGGNNASLRPNNAMLQQQQQSKVHRLSYSSTNSNPPVTASATASATPSVMDNVSKNQNANGSFHHFLADNVQDDDERMDTSGKSFSDSSVSKDYPKAQSTPSRDVSKDHRSIILDENAESPSKLSRSQGLPHLSLLQMRDEDLEQDDKKSTADSTDSEIYQSPVINDGIAENKMKGNGFEPTVLEPLNESIPFEAGLVNNETQSPFRSMDSSPSKKVYTGRHSKNSVSVSSMSQFSTVSDAIDNSPKKHKLYQLADKSSTQNELYVTASQFSLLGKDQSSVELQKQDTDSIKSNSFYDEKTPVIDQKPFSDERSSRRSSNGSFKNVLKSPNLFKRWSQQIKLQEINVSKNSDNPINRVNNKIITESNHQPFQSINNSSKSFVSDNNQSSLPKVKELNLTVDQLGIMEDKAILIRELDLVSNELAASIKREIVLDKKLQGISSSPQTDSIEHQLRNSALEISRLTKLLNEERKKRYIAEEHVLLQEHGVKPSALELNFENEKLKSELSMKIEIINTQSSDIEELKSEIPLRQQKVDELTATNKKLEGLNQTLNNEITVLHDDRNRLSILSQKFKILKNEKLQLEKELSNDSHLSRSINSEKPSTSTPPLITNHQRDFFTGKSPANSKTSNESIKSNNYTAKRLTSFSVVNSGSTTTAYVNEEQ